MLLLRAARLLLALSTFALAAVACSSRSDVFEGGDIDPACRANPGGDCEGLIGGRCAVTDDCADGVCCLDDKCGGGTCTYLCGGDRDCPGAMACENGFCFFRCGRDEDCGPGQKCERGDTICEYGG